MQKTETYAYDPDSVARWTLEDTELSGPRGWYLFLGTDGYYRIMPTRQLGGTYAAAARAAYQDISNNKDSNIICRKAARLLIAQKLLGAEIDVELMSTEAYERVYGYLSHS